MASPLPTAKAPAKKPSGGRAAAEAAAAAAAAAAELRGVAGFSAAGDVQGLPLVTEPFTNAVRHIRRFSRPSRADLQVCVHICTDICFVRSGACSVK